MRYPKGPESQTHRTFVGETEITPHQDDMRSTEEELNEEVMLPRPELFIPSGEGDGIVLAGWKAVKTVHNPETGVLETTVEKDGETKVFPTEQIEALQLEMYGIQSKRLGRSALDVSGVEAPVHEATHVTVVDPEGNEPPKRINVRHP